MDKHETIPYNSDNNRHCTEITDSYGWNTLTCHEQTQHALSNQYIYFDKLQILRFIVNFWFVKNKKTYTFFLGTLLLNK